MTFPPQVFVAHRSPTDQVNAMTNVNTRLDRLADRFEVGASGCFLGLAERAASLDKSCRPAPRRSALWRCRTIPEIGTSQTLQEPANFIVLSAPQTQGYPWGGLLTGQFPAGE